MKIESDFWNLCKINNSVIKGTIQVFPHKPIHKITWTSSDEKNALISKQVRKSVSHTRAMKRADASSYLKLIWRRIRIISKRKTKNTMQLHKEGSMI